MKLPFIITVVLMIVVIRHLVVILHELGHAIPALWLTREKVIVFLGSYGDEQRSKRFSVGKLEIWYDYKMMWQNGLCRPTAQNITVRSILIYTITGPTVPFLVGTTLFVSALVFALDDYLTLFGFLFLVIGLIDMLQNLVPSSAPINTGGKITYNDGESIRICLRHLRHGPHYFDGINFYNQADYGNAIASFQKMSEKHLRKPRIMRLLIAAQLLSRDFNGGFANLTILHQRRQATPDDYCNMGWALGELGEFDRSRGYYEKAVRINPGHKYSLNNLGYTANVQNRFEDAIRWSEKAIASDAGFSHPYNNRGFAKIKLGQIDSGLEDLNHALKLDPENAYVYRNFGIYHFESNIEKSTEYFKKAKELNPHTHQIDEWLARAERRMD